MQVQMGLDKEIQVRHDVKVLDAVVACVADVVDGDDKVDSDRAGDKSDLANDEDDDNPCFDGLHDASLAYLDVVDDDDNDKVRKQRDPVAKASFAIELASDEDVSQFVALCKESADEAD
jgi:hypothetical protein